MIKIPEYLAMGCPVVSYDLPESRVSAGDAAGLRDAGRPAALAAALDELLERSGRGVPRWPPQDSTRCATTLAWQHQVPALLAAYDRALGRATPPAGAARDPESLVAV